MHDDFQPTGNIRFKKGFIQIETRTLDCGAVVQGIDTDRLCRYIEVEGRYVNPKGTMLQTHATGGSIVSLGSTRWFSARVAEEQS